MRGWLEPCFLIPTHSFLMRCFLSRSVSVSVSFSPCPFTPQKTAGVLRGCQEKEGPCLLHCLSPLCQLYLNKYGLSWTLILNTAASILKQSKGCMFRQQGPPKVPIQLPPQPPSLHSHIHTVTKCSSPDVQRCVWFATENKTPTEWDLCNSCLVVSISLTGTYPEPCVRITSRLSM